MPPFPQDSDDDPEEMFIQDSDDEDFPYDEGDMENAIVLDDNDAPGRMNSFINYQSIPTFILLRLLIKVKPFKCQDFQ